MSEITHLSYSSVSRYLMCARSWRYHYQERLERPTAAALAFGSAFHETVESYLGTRALGGELKDGGLTNLWLDTWRAQIEQEGEIDWGGDSQEALSNTGLRILGNSVIKTELDGIKVKLDDGEPVIEKKVELNIPGVPIPVIGYIDLIAEDGVPGDIKTSGRSWSTSKAYAEAQPLFYLAALQQEGYSTGVKFRHYIFTKTKEPRLDVFETERTLGEIFWALEMVKDVWRGIEAQIFPPNPTSWKCQPRYCEFFDVCRGGTL